METTVPINERGYFSGAIGTLLCKAKIVPDYESGKILACTGTVTIVSDWFEQTVVQSDRELVTFERWCDITIGGKTVRVVVETPA